MTWAVDPSGLATTFIDGEVVWQFQLDWHAAARVFQTHRLGAPGMVHASNQIRHFTLDDPRDSAVSFTAFRGTLSRIAAWNTALGRISDGWDHLPGPDLTWSRTLLTVDSRRRYLHAGRLDASEPPVALFPMDLDGGLTIQSSLGQQHAELTLAHARLAEAYRQAADLKEAALQAAQDKVDRATADLVTAQAKATLPSVLRSRRPPRHGRRPNRPGPAVTRRPRSAARRAPVGATRSGPTDSSRRTPTESPPRTITTAGSTRPGAVQDDAR